MQLPLGFKGQNIFSGIKSGFIKSLQIQVWQLAVSNAKVASSENLCLALCLRGRTNKL
jgi:hypothetical protein